MDTKYKAVLFDLDGTLLNTIGDLAGAVNHVLEKYGQPTHPLEVIQSFVGNGIRNLMMRSVPGGEDCPTFEEEFEEFKSYYLDHVIDHTFPYPGIESLLSDLKKLDVKCAIVSNKFHKATCELSEHFFPDTIGVAIGDGEGRARKPATDAPFEAIRRLGVESSECLYVGDSQVDAATAENAGLPCVLVSWGFKSREELLDQKCIALVDDPEEILNIVKGV